MPILRIDIPATVPELRNYAASLKCPENTSVSDALRIAIENAMTVTII